jgi:4-hydroxyproline epimerase
VAVTLAHLGVVTAPGRFALETPVGPVRVELHSANEASITNVASFRHRSAVRIDVPAYGPVVGDVAWGGNWFFLVDVGEEALHVEDAPMLIARTEAIRSALKRQGVTGRDGAPIDHIELSGAPARSDADSRNFVLCPGGAYDRSPCGTGTSAKMACLYADHRLKEGELWRQEGILGTRFVGTAHVRDGFFTPIVRGRAYITNEGELVVDPADPLLPRP